MTDILSQDEIDTLLTSISTGEEDFSWASDDFSTGPSMEHKEKAKKLYKDIEESMQSLPKKEREDSFKNSLMKSIADLMSDADKDTKRWEGYKKKEKIREKEWLKIATLLSMALEKISRDV